MYTHLHGECQGVDDDEDEDAVLETTRRDEPPDLVLKPHAWNVAPLWLHLQRELDTLPLQTQTTKKTHAYIQNEPFFMSNFVVFYASAVHPVGRWTRCFRPVRPSVRACVRMYVPEQNHSPPASAVRRLPSAVRTATPAFHVRSSRLSVAGAAAWNSLPDYLRDLSRSFDSFRRDLKTFLFSFYQHTQRTRGFAIMRCINLLLTLTLTLSGRPAVDGRLSVVF